MDWTPLKPNYLRSFMIGFGMHGCLSLGCATVEDPSAFEQDFPPVRLLFVLPNNDQGEISPDSRIEFCWSQLLDPRSIHPGSTNLSSGQLNFDTDLEVQLFPWRVPVIGTELAQKAWCPGTVISITPRAPLEPGILYRVRMSSRFRGWAGEQLETDTPGWTENDRGDIYYYHEFTVANVSPQQAVDPGTDSDSTIFPPLVDSPGTIEVALSRASKRQEPSPPLYTLSQLFSAGQVFDPKMERCSCHLDPSSPAMGRLNLSRAETAFPDLNQRIMSTGFPMIAPRRPSDSYFIQKLLKTRDGQAIHLVRGAPMPPESLLSYVELASLARWIADGATL